MTMTSVPAARICTAMFCYVLNLIRFVAFSLVCFLSALVSAGIELIFFLVAGTVLCFGFSVRILLITL